MTVERGGASSSRAVPAIARKLQTLIDVGLGYMQPRPVGDHALRRRGAARQAVARALQARHRPHALHPRRADHRPALPRHPACCCDVLHRLRDAGNTVVVIEHNLDVIKTADWVIDLGPEGGDGGGRIVAAGTPEADFAGNRRKPYRASYAGEGVDKTERSYYFDARMSPHCRHSRRTKGEQTRAAILDEALTIVSKLGLEGLTIGTPGRCDRHVEVGPVRPLRLARGPAARGARARGAASTASGSFLPALKIARGLPRLTRAVRALARLDRSRPACPAAASMISAATEYDDRPGPIRDAVIANQPPRHGDHARSAVRLAIEEGHLSADTDPEQIAFEMLGIVLASHNHRRLLGDEEARKRALTAFEQLIERHAAAAPSRCASASR